MMCTTVEVVVLVRAANGSFSSSLQCEGRVCACFLWTPESNGGREVCGYHCSPIITSNFFCHVAKQSFHWCISSMPLLLALLD